MSLAASDTGNDTVVEKAADAVVHLLGLLGAGVALSRLFAEIGPGAATSHVLALAVYGLGLIGTLAMSALYNLSPAGSWKGTLRSCDRAMIFVMIAGSYTPFAATALPPALGATLCIVVWTLAAAGIAICLAWRRLYDRAAIALYLGMGWLVLAVLPLLVTAVPPSVLVLLLSGGILYSLGVVIHTRVRGAFHNAAWHATVVAAAALHLAAVAGVMSNTTR